MTIRHYWYRLLPYGTEIKDKQSADGLYKKKLRKKTEEDLS